MVLVEIIEGFIAVVIPHIVSICPCQDGWGVMVCGGPDAAEAKGGIVAKHFAKTVEEAKGWAATEIARRTGTQVELPWENLVCNPPRSQPPID
jgi:hypothetical protein